RVSQGQDGSIRWANDWNHIARRFLDYQRVVKHWESIPEVEWLDFEYEKVVEEPEKYARELIEFVGLGWEPGCLKFHETKRQVRTASLSQVREPIYKSSKAKWRNYESIMQPFLEKMGINPKD
ncbi:MAG: sulfotransferase, partial [Isosphaeraceae bacterium]